eukprot:TRINITY_DN53179_c0_g1_i1.p1 TRINITY_DN53179_c0_g1~~TRINITY_DN53179_c0_g1_i1.p1  ORF type:complete len:122 (-),score=28.69 TRINITY_DN53179_c0_g1_i1:160-525(-)
MLMYGGLVCCKQLQYLVSVGIYFFFLFNDTATTEIYTRSIVGSVRCVQETGTWGGAQGQATDVEIQVRELMKTKDHLNGIISKHTGKPIEQIEKDTDRNYWMNPVEAQEYGIIDKVIEKNQ